MKKLIAFLSLVPSVALAHPGHHRDGGVTHDAFITNPVLVIALCVAITYVATRIAKRVRS